MRPPGRVLKQQWPGEGSKSPQVARKQDAETRRVTEPLRPTCGNPAYRIREIDLAQHPGALTVDFSEG